MYLLLHFHKTFKVSDFRASRIWNYVKGPLTNYVDNILSFLTTSIHFLPMNVDKKSTFLDYLPLSSCKLFVGSFFRRFIGHNSWQFYGQFLANFWKIHLVILYDDFSTNFWPTRFRVELALILFMEYSHTMLNI